MDQERNDLTGSEKAKVDKEELTAVPTAESLEFSGDEATSVDANWFRPTLTPDPLTQRHKGQ